MKDQDKIKIKIKSITDQVIGLYIDKVELCKEAYRYLLNNDDFGIHIYMVLDKCLDYSWVKLRRKLSKLSDLATYAPQEDDITLE